MNKIVKYLIVILSFLSISLSINAFAANTDCRFGCEVLDVDTVVQTEPQKMICTTTITEPIKHPLWVVDGKSYGNLELDSVMLSAQSAEELIPIVLNSIGISISAEEIKDYTILPPNYGSAVYGVRGSAGAIVITTKKKIISSDHRRTETPSFPPLTATSRFPQNTVQWAHRMLTQ